MNSPFKGSAHSKNENLYFLAHTQTKLMQPILVSIKALFRSNLQKKWSSGDHNGPVSLTGPVFFCNLLLKGASHDTKIGSIRLVWAGNKKYKISFSMGRPFKDLQTGIQKEGVSKVVGSRDVKHHRLWQTDINT